MTTTICDTWLPCPGNDCGHDLPVTLERGPEGRVGIAHFPRACPACGTAFAVTPTYPVAALDEAWAWPEAQVTPPCATCGGAGTVDVLCEGCAGSGQFPCGHRSPCGGTGTVTRTCPGCGR